MGCWEIDIWYGEAVVAKKSMKKILGEKGFVTPEFTRYRVPMSHDILAFVPRQTRYNAMTAYRDCVHFSVRCPVL